MFFEVGVDTKLAHAALRERLPRVPLIGGTTSAEISGSMGALEGTVQVILFAGESLEVSTGRVDLDVAEGYSDVDSVRAAAQGAVAEARSSPGMRAPRTGRPIPASATP